MALKQELGKIHLGHNTETMEKDTVVRGTSGGTAGADTAEIHQREQKGGAWEFEEDVLDAQFTSLKSNMFPKVLPRFCQRSV